MTTFARGTCWCLRTVLVAMCVGAVPHISTAAQRQSATLEGTVQDGSGGVVAGASITVRDAETNLVHATRTDALGSFRLTDLAIGTYEVRVEAPGFAPYTHAGVVLAIGQTARLLVVLQPAQVVEEVAVSAQPPALDSRQPRLPASSIPSGSRNCRSVHETIWNSS
jgi:hypothetical protein